MKLSRPRTEIVSSLRAAEIIGSDDSSENNRFNPDVDISEDDRETFLQLMEHFKRQGNDEAFAEAAMHYLQMFPEDRAKLGLDVELYDELRERAEKSYILDKFLYLEKLARLVLLYPEKRAELELDNKRVELLMMIDSYLTVGNILAYARYIKYYVYLYPHRRADLQLDEVYQDLVARAESIKDKFDKSAVFDSLSILYPERRHEWDLGSLQEDLEREIERARGKNVREQQYTALTCAARLSLVLASGVEITEDGVRLLYQQGLPEIPGLPERDLASII